LRFGVNHRVVTDVDVQPVGLIELEPGAEIEIDARLRPYLVSCRLEQRLPGISAVQTASSQIWIGCTVKVSAASAAQNQETASAKDAPERTRCSVFMLYPPWPGWAAFVRLKNPQSIPAPVPREFAWLRRKLTTCKAC
jgi:hypothetical protein